MNNYTETTNQYNLLMRRAKSFTDEEIADECSHLLIIYENDIIDKVLKAYFKTGKLSADNRKSLDNFYILDRITISCRL